MVREGLSEYPYLLILMKLWPGGWKNQSERMNMKVDEDYGKPVVMVNVQAQKVWHFQAMNFGRTWVVLFQVLPLVLVGQGCGRRKRHKI